MRLPKQEDLHRGITETPFIDRNQKLAPRRFGKLFKNLRKIADVRVLYTLALRRKKLMISHSHSQRLGRRSVKHSEISIGVPSGKKRCNRRDSAHRTASESVGLKITLTRKSSGLRPWQRELSSQDSRDSRTSRNSDGIKPGLHGAFMYLVLKYGQIYFQIGQIFDS